MANGISPIAPGDWLRVARFRATKKRGLTPWFDGRTKPARRGYYERHFTDSLDIPQWMSMHWWDGKKWLSRKGGLSHWRQVGDYPCWRGLTTAAFMSPSRYPVARG
jgi:hypothetical protein